MQTLATLPGLSLQPPAKATSCWSLPQASGPASPPPVRLGSKLEPPGSPVQGGGWGGARAPPSFSPPAWLSQPSGTMASHQPYQLLPTSRFRTALPTKHKTRQHRKKRPKQLYFHVNFGSRSLGGGAAAKVTPPPSSLTPDQQMASRTGSSPRMTPKASQGWLLSLSPNPSNSFLLVLRPRWLFLNGPQRQTREASSAQLRTPGQAERPRRQPGPGWGLSPEVLPGQPGPRGTGWRWVGEGELPGGGAPGMPD